MRAGIIELLGGGVILLSPVGRLGFCECGCENESSIEDCENPDDIHERKIEPEIELKLVEERAHCDKGQFRAKAEKARKAKPNSIRIPESITFLLSRGGKMLKR